MIRRQMESVLKEDLEEKMVLLAGPRQCGKTTLARSLLAEQSGRYYSWDVGNDRHAILNDALEESAPLWVLDELHKFTRWRNWLKGQYDLHHPRHRILVTGSATLDFYNRGGDSLQGRYFSHRLHPLTLAEVLGEPALPESRAIPDLPRLSPPGAQAALDALFEFGGFPEPFLKASARFAARWRRGYGARLVHGDMRDRARVRELERVELLFERLSDVVGSVLSINSLREDLEVAFDTVRAWLATLERLYACFRVSPYGPPQIKAVKKEQKLYLWDWSRVPNPAARFENLIALHLLRLQHWCEDMEGAQVELRYFRNAVGKEVDFVLLRDRKPWIALEVKESDQPLADGLRYLLERVPFPYAFQLSRSGTLNYRPQDIRGCYIRMLPAATFLANLP